MLERLILLRHAKAVREHEAPSDFERGLTERGFGDAAAAGAAIAALGWEIDVALASPAARTLQTLRTVAPDLSIGRMLTPADLYLAEAATLFRAASSAEASCVLIVAHNPGLHDLAIRLVTSSGLGGPQERKLLSGLPTSAWAAFTLSGSTLEAPGARLAAIGMRD
jgi:phosphohistidine phosphatase